MIGLEGLLGERIEAQLKYLDGDFSVIKPGHFVRCAVSGDPIALDNLKYWSVEHQEAYKDASLAMKRYLELTEGD